MVTSRRRANVVAKCWLKSTYTADTAPLFYLFELERLMKVRSLLALLATVAAAMTAQAAPITVVSNVVEDIWLFNSTNRGEMIMNNLGTNGGRWNANRYDATILAAQPFTDASQYELTSATLTVKEQAGRDGNNGTQQGRVGAYFYNTLENGDWSLANTGLGGNSGAGVSNDVGGWYGNSGGRPGRLGGDGPAGAPNNVDERSNGATDLTFGLTSPAPAGDGSSWVDHTFTTADANETATIDLTDGGATLADIQGILADWVGGNNAGLILAGEFGNQSFWRSNNVAVGASVGSTIDGDSSASGVSLEDGNGQAGADAASFLTLTFERVIPEPGTAVLSMLALAGFGAMGMRSRLG